MKNENRTITIVGLMRGTGMGRSELINSLKCLETKELIHIINGKITLENL